MEEKLLTCIWFLLLTYSGIYAIIKVSSLEKPFTAGFIISFGISDAVF